jgi:hypothetical protein
MACGNALLVDGLREIAGSLSAMPGMHRQCDVMDGREGKAVRPLPPLPEQASYL